MIINIDNIYTGDVVSFRYMGGTSPNKQRIVYVFENNIKSNLIRCWDFSVNDIRCFKYNYIKDIEFVDSDNIKYFDMNNAYSSATVEYVCQQFENDGYMTYYHEKDNMIIAVKENTKPHTQYSIIVTNTKTNNIVEKYIFNNFTEMKDWVDNPLPF